VLHSIILDSVQIKDHACVSYSIVGWNSVIGQWSRLEGVPDYSVEVADQRACGMTILGKVVQ
jgi:mannose-1-phosphate guanylyltransferase